MQERSIDGALLALRRVTIREGREGLALVEALLELRGVPLPRVLPAKRPDAARKGLMSRLVLEALRDGPLTALEVSSYVAARRPEISFGATHKRVAQVLTKLKNAFLLQCLVAIEAIEVRL